MALLSRSEFKALCESAQDYSVSIFMPTHPAGPEMRQDPIRLKNLLGEAEETLQQTGVPASTIDAILSPAFSLLENAHFWQYQQNGLALFLTPDTMRYYRLPLDLAPLVTVTDRFHLKPLLPLFFDDRYFYILALSQNQVRFFQSTRYHISEVSLEGVPSSLAEALKYDQPEEQLQFHSSNRGGTQPVYHGHGVGTTDDKNDIHRFLVSVRDGLQRYLNEEDAPLVVAAVDYVQSIFQDLNSYPSLVKEGVAGNPDVATPDDLRKAAWPKVSALLEQSCHEAIAHYQELHGTGEASDQLTQLIPAAHRGQVDTLFVTANAHQWGTFAPATGKIEIHEQPQLLDYDLLDLAAVQTFLNGGTVYTLEHDAMPDAAQIAAILRYGIPASV
jgi:hypothetical protein